MEMHIAGVTNFSMIYLNDYWEVLEVLIFKSHVLQAWKVLESGLGPGKSWKCE